MYKNDKACVKIDGQLSPEFKTQSGVRQGCIMSPLLFNIFMSDMPGKLNQEDQVSLCLGGKINCLLWADDILILSETEAGLNTSLEKLNEYCKINALTVNTDKTKCMIFNKTGRLMRRTFFIGNDKIENVRSYKYLGLVFTPSGEVKSALDDLRSRALKANMSLKHKLGNCFNSYIEETKKLFDSLVKPILLYSSDFWGCLKLPVNNPIENMHTMLCNQLLGVHKSTTNDGVLIEVGRVPIVLSAQKAEVKNWVRIHNLRTNNLLKKSYEGARADALDWLTKIKTCLVKTGIGNYMVNEGAPHDKNLHLKYFSRLKDVFYQTSLSSITNPNGKLRTYGLIKQSKDTENYLNVVRNIKHRISLSRFRLSNHKLMIEVGRHQKLPRHERRCPFCTPTCIEDEIHFLIQCDVYTILRNTLFKFCTEQKPNFYFYTHKEKFIFIMTHPCLCKEVAKFVFKAMEVRNNRLDIR